MSKSISRWTMVGLVLVAGSQAWATPLGTIQGTETGVLGKIVDIHGAYNLSGWAGIYHFNKTDGTGLGESLANGQIDTFCTELAQYSPSSTVWFDLYPTEMAPIPGKGMGATKADMLDELWGRYFDQIDNDAVRAATFQVCVWEIGHETSGTYNVSSGSMWFGGNYNTSLATSWLSSLDGTGPKADLVAMTNSSCQDYIVNIPTPEPSVLVTMVVGTFFVVRRRRA